jgi:2-polyprenyl-6-methoxyphenol hydroxylase-like FAD-dependent oxidoreductase
LQYRVSEILACLGVVDRFLELGSSPTPVNIYEGERKLVRFQFDLPGRQSGRDAFTPRPIMLAQSETERLLGELLRERGGEVEWGTEFVSFSQGETGDRSTVRQRDGTEKEIVSLWLVSCEGAHSVIRKQAGISFTGKTCPLAFALADVEIDWPISHEENHV